MGCREWTPERWELWRTSQGGSSTQTGAGFERIEDAHGLCVICWRPVVRGAFRLQKEGHVLHQHCLPLGVWGGVGLWEEGLSDPQGEFAEPEDDSAAGN
jgi:hypothetical protein